jgi:hypothetical protein
MTEEGFGSRGNARGCGRLTFRLVYAAQLEMQTARAIQAPPVTRLHCSTVELSAAGVG